MRRGFTLIELAFVLAVIGVLAALAVPGYRGLVLRPRAAEARMGVEGIADAELRYFRDHGKFVPCGSMPAATPRGNTAAFDRRAPGWKELAFSMEGSVRYRYEVVLDGDSFKVLARGDLDGDGVESLYTLRGRDLALSIEEELE